MDDKIERVRRKVREFDVGDIVRPAHAHFPKGTVTKQLPLGMVAVDRPDGMFTIHHESTLRKVC